MTRKRGNPCRPLTSTTSTINYRLEGDGAETIVLVNGLADDLETWVFQMDDLLGAGYRVLRFDNRGIGELTSAPPGPYTTACSPTTPRRSSTSSASPAST